jgi:hypothetical protein
MTNEEMMVPLEWNLITADHVRQACDAVARRYSTDLNTGLIVHCSNRSLPAKAVLREAYRLAKGLPAEAEVRFTSGEASLNRLRKLGFSAERLTPPGTPGHQS